MYSLSPFFVIIIPPAQTQFEGEALAIGILAIMTVQDSSRAQVAASSKPKAPDSQYEVLSPWADVDPIPLRGISPRISEFPKNWDKLVAKYKNLKPNYEPY